MKKELTLLSTLAVAALVLAGCAADDGSQPSVTTTVTAQADGSTDGGAQVSLLESVQAAGTVRCGTRDALPGFAVLDSSGEHVGFDSDFCRVIAAAVLGDAGAVDMVDLETSDRFTALQNGSIDVLVRNTTWTATRDGAEASTFLQPTFYDGQGVMVA
ncbi:MAG TPA: transporter substrate-binding domain-containing protein, partial [Aquiluna sp.]